MEAHRHHDDVLALMIIAAKNGHVMSYNEVVEAWDAYSDMMAAGWMMLKDNDDETYSDLMWGIKLLEKW